MTSSNDSGSRGWTNSPLELLKIQLLDLIEERTAEGRVPAVQAYAGHLSEDHQLLNTAVNSLTADGLVHVEPTLGGALYATVTTAGSDLVQRRRELRSNKRARAVACRDALLDWCYEQESPALDSFAADARAHFYGDPFTAEEFRDASLDLKSKGLISGTEAWGAGVVRPEITTHGKDVVERHESSIVDYESADRSAPGTTTYNFGGSNISGQVSIGDHNQLHQDNNASPSELTQLITAVLEAAKEAGQQDRVGKLITQLQIEAEEDEPESTIMSTTLDRLENVAKASGSAVLVAATKQLITFAAQAFGLN
jgi:hypothetical protein